MGIGKDLGFLQGITHISAKSLFSGKGERRCWASAEGRLDSRVGASGLLLGSHFPRTLAQLAHMKHERPSVISSCYVECFEHRLPKKESPQVLPGLISAFLVFLQQPLELSSRVTCAD